MVRLNFSYLVFSGGGQKGNAFIGALKALEMAAGGMQQLQQQVRGCAGSSYGAMMALAFCAHSSIDSLENFQLAVSMEDLVDRISVTDVYKKCGLIPKEYITEHLHQMMAICVPELSQTVTFKQLLQTTNKVLKVVVSDLTRGDIAVFDVDSSPDMSVVDAVSISMSLPFLVHPTRLPDGRWYTDGGLYCNFPIHLFPANEVLGIRVTSKNTLPDDFNISNFVPSIAASTLDYHEANALRGLSPEYADRVITISLPPCSLWQLIFADVSVRRQYMATGFVSTIMYIFFVLIFVGTGSTSASTNNKRSDGTYLRAFIL